MSRLERIVATCGGVVFDNGRRALIAGPDHGPTDRSVSLLETDDGRILVHCFSPRDDWRTVRDALAARGLLDGAPDLDAPPILRRPSRHISVQPSHEVRVARAQRLWDAGLAIPGTPAEIYLRRRAIDFTSALSPALRFHPQMTNLDDRLRRPALIAALTDDEGAICGVQATLLTPRGEAKAAVATPRRFIGQLSGGSVRLQGHDDTLVIAEGVETAMSASASLGLPAWAALSAINLSRFKVPSGLRRLVIAPDRDRAGYGAADALRGCAPPHVEVTIACSPEGFNDWNDWARRDQGA